MDPGAALTGVIGNNDGGRQQRRSANHVPKAPLLAISTGPGIPFGAVRPARKCRSRPSVFKPRCPIRPSWRAPVGGGTTPSLRSPACPTAAAAAAQLCGPQAFLAAPGRCLVHAEQLLPRTQDSFFNRASSSLSARCLTFSSLKASLHFSFSARKRPNSPIELRTTSVSSDGEFPANGRCHPSLNHILRSRLHRPKSCPAQRKPNPAPLACHRFAEVAFSERLSDVVPRAGADPRKDASRSFRCLRAASVASVSMAR
jgi:hypothetical protein